MSQETESVRVEQVDIDAANRFTNPVDDPILYRLLIKAFVAQRLAAIEATTEAAANHIERHYDSGDRDTRYEWMIVEDLRNNRHLETRHD